MYIALTQSLEIYQNKDGSHSLGAIPTIMTKALGVSFDSHIGHDFFKDAEERFKFYHAVEHKIPFSVNLLNQITKGGVSKKSLTILMAGVHVGKSACMCSMAADNLKDNKNVLYITLEMSEEMITHRIDANLMDMKLDDIFELPHDQYMRNIDKIKKLTSGTLKVKEYPTKQAGSANFRFLLNELKLKQNFVPDIIYIDYMNICISSTLKNGKASLYEYVKTISEELRGLAVEFELPIITATQFNREGFKSSDPGMQDVSESFGTNATADLILALVRSEELNKLNQIMVSQLKNRYSDPGKLPRFVLGFNIEKMQIIDVPDKEQTLYHNDQEATSPFITNEMDRDSKKKRGLNELNLDDIEVPF